MVALGALQQCSAAPLPALHELAVLLHDNALLALGEQPEVQVSSSWRLHGLSSVCSSCRIWQQ